MYWALVEALHFSRPHLLSLTAPRSVFCRFGACHETPLLFSLLINRDPSLTYRVVKVLYSQTVLYFVRAYSLLHIETFFRSESAVLGGVDSRVFFCSLEHRHFSNVSECLTLNSKKK